MTAQASRKRSPFDGEANLHFDNSGQYPLVVPGFGYPVPIERPADERFAHGFGDWAQNRLTAREIAMLKLMNNITDRPRWHLDIKDPAIIVEWASEALSSEMISPATWDWCYLELLDKAELYGRSNLTHILDSASRICKSDDLVSPEVLEKLSSEFVNLPDSVDPDLFPLVYGHTRFLENGGRVGCLNAADFAGKGEVSNSQIWRCSSKSRVRCDGSPRILRGSNRGMGTRGRGRGGASACARCGKGDYTRNESSWEPRGHRFSSEYQWLPSEIRFEAGSGRVLMSSYINNLHPRNSPLLYDTIRRCIDASLQPWNEVLVRRDRGRTPERIRTHGVQWTPFPPSQADLDDLDRTATVDGALCEATRHNFQYFMDQPDNPAVLNSHYSAGPRRRPHDGSDEKPSTAVLRKYHRMKKWLHPEPGVSFTYNDWKQGRNNQAIVPGTLPPKKDHDFYTVDLAKDFAKEGIQVVVEIGSVDLTPEQPTKLATDWGLSGLPNEHIVATSVVYFGSENIAPASGSFSFRVEADLDPDAHIWGRETGSAPHHPLAPLANIYDFETHQDIQYDYCGGPPWPVAALQYLGDVSTPDGRLVAFPNVMQHRVNAYNLLDVNRPGCRRFLKLHLVDPNYRIASTRNVPPQRYDWWYGAGLGRIDWKKYDIPHEIVLEIETLVGDAGIRMGEAERLRENIREERKAKFELLNEEEVERYYFALCEMDA